MLDKFNKMLDIAKWRLRNTKNNNKTLFVLGNLICLADVGRMFDRAILSEITTNVATVLGITRICLIVTQRRAMNKGGE